VRTEAPAAPLAASVGPDSVEDVFLANIAKHKTPVTVFLVSGVKLQGIVPSFDNFSVLLRREGHSQLVYKHAISSIMPAKPAPLAAQDEG
jgi:host factor-I protein